MTKALTFQVHGLGGRNLNREWEAGASSYKGLAVSGYPNYFKVNGPNTGSGHSSQISYIEAATDYIRSGHRRGETRPEPQGHRCRARPFRMHTSPR